MAQAKTCLEEALELSRHVNGELSWETARTLTNLGDLYLKLKELPLARRSWEEALAIHREIHGEAHPATAEALHNFGGLLSEMGDDASAIRLHEQALNAGGNRSDSANPHTALVLDDLSSALARQSDWNGATNRRDEERRIARRHIGRVLPGLAENEQLVFLRKTERRHFWSAASLALHERGQPGILGQSAAWIINGKGVAEESLASRALLARETRDPKLAAAARDLLGVRQRLASLGVTTAPAVDGEEQAGERRKLIEREARLSRALFQQTRTGSGTDPWIELDTVRHRIPLLAVVVSIIRFDYRDLESNIWKPARYAAWVIPPAGERDVALVDLGEAAAIDQAVLAVRKSLAAAAAGSKLPAADPGLAKNLAHLAELVYQPLAPHLESARDWIISPDSALWLVPWAALPVENDTYALERHTIRYLISGRELVADGERTKWQQPGFALADPDFDAELATPASAVPKAEEKTPPPLLAATSSRGAAPGLPTHWARLPGTANELKAMLPKLERYLGASPQAYTGAEATEAAFKQTQRPRVVVLSTHGFALPDDDVSAKPAETKPTGKTPPKPADDKGRFNNPLLRCGLVLAGANRTPAERPAGSDDGILTGLEIVGTDLRGTELVVLSACETGLGELRSGEGVAGLRQAFQLAGARSVVSTLWQIPDQETAWLMTRFWENLAAGLDAAEALRDAQLLLLNKHRRLVQLAARNETAGLEGLLASRGLKAVTTPPKPESAPAADGANPTPGRAHPLLWAAFTLTGPPDAAGATPAPAPSVPASAK